MITCENEIKVVDFGIATLKEDLIKEGRHAILGTPCYMSPEQIEGETNDQRTDIYSAGVTLFHLTTGSTPYNGSVLEIFNKHLKEPVPSIKEARDDSPGTLRRLIEKCMAKKKEDRYQSARQVLEELDKSPGINGDHIEIGKTTLKIIEDGDSKTLPLSREISLPGSPDESDLPTTYQSKS
jgi:serine/threonine-protein kinase